MRKDGRLISHTVCSVNRYFYAVIFTKLCITVNLQRMSVLIRKMKKKMIIYIFYYFNYCCYFNLYKCRQYKREDSAIIMSLLRFQ